MLTLERDDAPPASGAHVQTNSNLSHTTGPVRLSKALHRVALDILYRELADQVDYGVLVHLAAVRRETSLAARRRLSDEGIEVLVDIITNRHSVPTVGFWRRYAA